MNDEPQQVEEGATAAEALASVTASRFHPAPAINNMARVLMFELMRRGGRARVDEVANHLMESPGNVAECVNALVRSKMVRWGKGATAAQTDYGRFRLTDPFMVLVELINPAAIDLPTEPDPEDPEGAALPW